MQLSTLLKQGRAKICSCLWNPTKDWLTKLLSLVLHSLVFKINLMVQQWQKSRIYLISREAKLPNGDSILEKTCWKKLHAELKSQWNYHCGKGFISKCSQNTFFHFTSWTAEFNMMMWYDGQQSKGGTCPLLSIIYPTLEWSIVWVVG